MRASHLCAPLMLGLATVFTLVFLGRDATASTFVPSSFGVATREEAPSLFDDPINLISLRRSGAVANLVIGLCIPGDASGATETTPNEIDCDPPAPPSPPESFFGQALLHIPNGWVVGTGAGVTDGAFVGKAQFEILSGLGNSACSAAGTIGPLNFDLMDGTLSTTTKVRGWDDDDNDLIPGAAGIDGNDGADTQPPSGITNNQTPEIGEQGGTGDGIPNGVDQYPEFLEENPLRDQNGDLNFLNDGDGFRPQASMDNSPSTEPLLIARWYGQAVLTGSGTLTQVHFIWSELDDGRKRAEIIIGDPLGPPTPSALGSTCTPFRTLVTTFGYSRDNPVSPANECCQIVRRNGTNAGTPGSTIAYTFSEEWKSIPDADSDGWTNDLDNCAIHANANQADADLDGIGDACDPTGVNTNAGDHDLDGWFNADDNCPLVANGLAAARPQEDDDVDVFGVWDPTVTTADGIGDACEPDWDPSSAEPIVISPTAVDGHQHSVPNTHDINVHNCRDINNSGAVNIFDAQDVVLGVGGTPTSADTATPGAGAYKVRRDVIANLAINIFDAQQVILQVGTLCTGN